mgnify:CR=1 FL=1
MKTTRKKYTAAFKAQVAIEAIKERETLAELSNRFGVHSVMISKWKQELLERSSEIYQTKGPEKDFENERQTLYAKIGQLEVQRDWLKKISNQAGL